LLLFKRSEKEGRSGGDDFCKNLVLVRLSEACGWAYIRGLAGYRSAKSSTQHGRTSALACWTRQESHRINSTYLPLAMPDRDLLSRLEHWSERSKTGSDMDFMPSRSISRQNGDSQQSPHVLRSDLMNTPFDKCAVSQSANAIKCLGSRSCSV
jgi:hypothetical protein